MSETTAIPRGVLTDRDVQSCDWGSCNEDAVAKRWAEDLGEWLSVCPHHTEENR
jgi:hypothetical protein